MGMAECARDGYGRPPGYGRAKEMADWRGTDTDARPATDDPRRAWYEMARTGEPPTGAPTGLVGQIPWQSPAGPRLASGSDKQKRN